ncbi:Fe-S cluster assembly protein SufD [Rubellicoccus peritrichatus]|uniref:Fe-S cluster assembly protein SufD n=1 Tax=Rubellicoccus peritrichatus TaxID=3080537 RepID=A0AAQ3LE85_9BACT|nr:Fe-S cluster assembly protein SufD [Puniceicoccus sp. CR14]WOO42340.1 Fe-S cluster assembly protein SufD [Puniceicoccus sp. CR14]
MPTLETLTFDKASFDAHVADFVATPWLQEFKRNAWAQYEALPMPNRSDEKWRFSDLKKITLDGFKPATEPHTEEREALLERSHLVDGYSGRMVFGDNHLLEFNPVSEELADKGVIWLPLQQAISEHPELVKKYLGSEDHKLGGDKFRALHYAFLQGGSFLYVPKGVEIEAPFVAYYWNCHCEEAIFPHTLIVADSNAKVNFVDYYGSKDSECNCPTLSIAAGASFAEPGGQIFRKVVQDYHLQTVSLQLEANIAKRDANVKTIALNLGAKYARIENQTRIAEPGSNVHVYSLTVATGEQEFDQRTLQTHAAPNAYSDLLYKNALLDKARTIFSGMILVEPDAQKTDAYQTNRNLLLSAEAEANSLPGLEIEANDVKCSHGATTGQIDQEQLFYLMARGIPRETAYELLIFGFFEEIIEKFDNEELKENVRSLVRSKFDSR